jgi:hypothetical protein
MMCYRSRPDECDVGNVGMRGQMVSNVGPADDRLDDMRRVSARYEGRCCD